MVRKNRRLKLSTLAVVAAAATPVVKAQTSDWTGASSTSPNNNWTDTTNWDLGVPVSGNIAAFGDIANGNTSISLGGASQPIGGISFTAPSSNYNLGITAGDSFLFDGNGWIGNTGAAAQIISAGIVTQGNLSATNSVGNGVTNGAGIIGLTLNAIQINNGMLTVTNGNQNITTVLNGNITETAGQPGSLSLVATSAGGGNNNNFIINGNNTYSGTTSINVNTGSGGSIQLATDSPFGTNKVIMSLVTGTSSPQFMALGGTRTISNAFDLGAGLTFVGSNGFTFTGGMNLVTTASRTMNNLSTATVTFGSAATPSFINLGNPISNGGDDIGRTLSFAESTAGGQIVINDVLQNPGTGSGSVTYSAVNGSTITINSQNTYTGSTTIGSGTGGTIAFNHDYIAGGTSGPFGLGTLITNNTNNPQLTPIGGNRTLANTVQMNFGFTVANAAGDTSSLTFTGPMSLTTNGRVVTNNLSTNGATLTLGLTASPSTITLAGTNGGALQFGGVGHTVINDSFQNQGTNIGAINFAGSGTIDQNSAINIASGSLTISSSGTVNLNKPNGYSGNTTLSGGGTIIPIQFDSSGTTGTFGTGTIIFNNSNNQHLIPTGGDRTIANAVTMTTGFAMANNPGETYNLTFTGPITMQTAGRFIANGFSGGQTNVGGVLILGNPLSPSTITLPSPTNGVAQTLNFSDISGPIVVNDVIRNGTMAGNVGINPNNSTSAYVALNAQNTYTGSTTIGGGTNVGGSVLLGVSSISSGTNVVSGPFGTGTLIMNQPAGPAAIVPTGADRTVANVLTLNSGFIAANSGSAAFNLAFTGPITLGTTPRVITNNMVAGTALSLGAPTAVSTLSLNSTLQLQSQIAGGPTVINDLVQDGTSTAGGILVTSGLTQLTNTGNSYSGGSTVNGGVLSISADGNLGNTSGTVSVGAGTLLATGSFTTARGFSLTDSTSSTLDATAGNTMILSGAMTDAGSINKGTNAGTVQLTHLGGYTAGSNVSVLGGKLAFGDTVNGITGPWAIPGTLNISDGALASFIPATGTAITHTITNLNLNTAGKLDVGNSSFLTNSNVQPYLAAGYNNGAWNGSGAAIISTSANTAPGTAARSLGFASDADQAAGRVAAGNPTLAAGQTLVKYTTPGDADLSGKSDFNDFLAMQNNFNKAGNWTQGDFDYNGTTNFNDFLILQNNFNRGLNANGTVAHSAVSKLTASPAAVTPSVTYILSKNDDGKGNLTPGKYAVYAVDSSADGNQGVASFSVDVQGASLVTNFAPQGTFDKGQGNGSTVVEGFTLLRSVSGAFSTGTDPVKGSQDTVDDQSGVVLIYGMGQVAGNLNTKAPSGSTGGSGKVQASYGSPLLISTGTFASGLAFNSDQTFDKANVFLTNTAADTEAAGISLVTQDLSVGVPEPTALSLVALGAGSLLARRKRRK